MGDAKSSDDKGASDVLKTLQAAVKGLHWPSEADKPVKAFQWKDGAGGKVDEATVRAAAKIGTDATVKPLALDEFFAPVVTAQDWFGDDEKATMKQFQTLKDALTSNLTDVTVYRVEGNHSDKSLVDTFVVGQTKGDGLAGISTQMVET